MGIRLQSSSLPAHIKPNRILVYNFESEDAGDYTFADSVKASIYDDLLINFSNIADLLNT